MINGQLFTSLLFSEDGDPKALNRLAANLSQMERVKLFYSLLQYLTSTFFSKPGDSQATSPNPVISAVAGLIRKVTCDEPSQKSWIVSWLTGPVGAGPNANIAIRRAAFACLAEDEDTKYEIMEKSLNQFADDLYIKHTPMLQQEGKPIHTPSFICPRDPLIPLSPFSGCPPWRWASQSIVTPEVQDASPFTGLP